jgi:hypothetical protein
MTYPNKPDKSVLVRNVAGGTSVISEKPDAPGRERSRSRRAANLVLLLALAAVVILYAVARSHGYQALVVLSGASTDVPAGSLVVGGPLPAERVEVGDVILLREGRTPVLHRIIERTPNEDGSVVVRTQSDISAVPDPDPHTLSGPATTPVYVVPKLGYAINALRSTTGWIVLGVVLLVITVVNALRRRARQQAGRL